MSLPTPKEKQRFVDLLMALREFLRTPDDAIARCKAETLVDEIAKEDE